MLREETGGLTEDFTDHEDQADNRDHVQTLPGYFLLLLAILLSMAVVMAMLDAVRLHSFLD